MPPAPVPPGLTEFLRRPNPAVIASLRADGSPHTVATWYDWEDDRVLLSMDADRARLRFIRRDPRVALTVLDAEYRDRHVSLLGVVASLVEDAGLVDMDRLARRYTAEPFPSRDRRRFSAWVHVEHWHAWDGSGPWQVGS